MASASDWGFSHSAFFPGWGSAVRLWKKEGDSYTRPRMLVEHRCSFKVQVVHVHPRFTPDGTKVLYTSDWTGYGPVYLADLVDFESLPEIGEQ